MSSRESRVTISYRQALQIAVRLHKPVECINFISKVFGIHSNKIRADLSVFGRFKQLYGTPEPDPKPEDPSNQEKLL